MSFVAGDEQLVSAIDLPYVLVHAYCGDFALLADIPARGLCIPSGHIEYGEEPLRAALRETYEETGGHVMPAKCKLIGYHCFVARTGEHAGQRKYAAAYVAEVDRFDPIPPESESKGRCLIAHAALAKNYFYWDELMACVFDFAREERRRLLPYPISETVR